LSFVLELLEHVTAHWGAALQQHTDMITLYKEEICGIIFKYLMTNNSAASKKNADASSTSIIAEYQSFPVMHKLYKLCASILRNFHEHLVCKNAADYPLGFYSIILTIFVCFVTMC